MSSGKVARVGGNNAANAKEIDNAAPASFSKLKKDLLFHEKRLQLLGTRVVEDLESHLIEKTLSRQECRNDCRDAIAKFEIGATDATLSGRWDEHKVANLFGLEVPLDLVVGSSRFEAPAAADCNAIRRMIEELQVIGRRFPEFSVEGEDDAKGVEELMDAINDVQWGARDVARMKEAVSAKVAVLTDLNELADELQHSSFNIGQLQSQLESLRRAEERAREDGEMAVCDSIIREKLQIEAQIMNGLLEECNRIAQAEETNITKRRSNIAVFQGASAMLEVLKSEKAEFVAGCKRDQARIERGVQYEDRATGSNRRKTREELDRSMSKIKALDDRQEKLSNRLLEIFKDFQETEQALEKVGVERAKAVAEHVELVEDSRHIMSDMIELTKWANVQAENLKKTHEEYQRGLHGLAALDQVLLQKQGFDKYDFNATGRRLQSMMHNAALRLNKTLNDYEAQAADLMRRQNAQLKQLDEEIDVAECEVELHKDVFAPETKKYVLRARQLHEQRDAIAKDLDNLAANLEQMKNMCMDTVCKHLSQQEIERVEERTAMEALQRREDLVDMRQQLLQPKENDIHGERAALLVDRQSTSAVLASSPARQKRPTSTGASKGNEVVPVASSGNSSRVLNVRDEVEKSKKLLAQLEEEAIAAQAAAVAQSALEASGKASGDDGKSGKEKGRRPVRVIGSSTS